MADMMMMAAAGEGKTRSLANAGRAAAAAAAATAERCGEGRGAAVASDREVKALAQHPSQTGVFDVQRGRGNCSGYDNQVARKGRGMCLAKQAAGNETSDGQAAASVSDMGEQTREEVDSG